MKKLIVALALVTAGVAGPALAGVGVSIELGAPGFYGQLDIGGYQPRVLYDRPVIAAGRARFSSPVYLRVPAGQERNWRSYCGRYQACDRPVYFVRDDWYRNEYAPRYRNQHARDWRDDRRDDYRGDRRDDRSNDHADHRDGGRDNRQDQRHDRADGRRNDGHDDRNDHHDGNDNDNNGRRW